MLENFSPVKKAKRSKQKIFFFCRNISKIHFLVCLTGSLRSLLQTTLHAFGSQRCYVVRETWPVSQSGTSPNFHCNLLGM